jgi:hypothetical protein
MSSAPSALGISEFSLGDREERAEELGGAHHRGQLRHAQASASPTLVGRTATILYALHSDLFLLAQSGGDLVQSHYATSHSPRDVSQREGAGRENRSLRPEREPPGATVRLDRHGRFGHRQSRTTMYRNFRDSTLAD